MENKIKQETFENAPINMLKDVKEFNTKPDNNSMLVDVPSDFYSHAKEEIIIPEINKDDNFDNLLELYPVTFYDFDRCENEHNFNKIIIFKAVPKVP